jgi:hypothetical protein
MENRFPWRKAYLRRRKICQDLMEEDLEVWEPEQDGDLVPVEPAEPGAAEAAMVMDGEHPWEGADIIPRIQLPMRHRYSLIHRKRRNFLLISFSISSQN